MIAAIFAVCVCAGARAQAQESNSQPGSQQPGTQQPASQPQPSSSSQSSSSTQGQSQEQTPAYGVYLSIDPLAKVRYDNRYDMSLGFAYDHMKAGPTLLQGSNLGGLDMEGSYWLSRNWGIVASGRAMNDPQWE